MRTVSPRNNQQMEYLTVNLYINNSVLLKNIYIFFLEFQVVAGKYYSEDIIDKQVTEQFEQVRIVKTSDVRYSNDLAVVVLKEPFLLNEAIQPVCVDWDSQFEFDHLDVRRNGTVSF